MPRAPKRAKSPSTAQLAAQIIRERKSAAQLIKQRPERYSDKEVMSIIFEAVKTTSPAKFLLSKGLNAPRLRERFVSTRNLIGLGFSSKNLHDLGFSLEEFFAGKKKFSAGKKKLKPPWAP